MDKISIMNDKKFKDKCKELGVLYKNIDIYDNMIIVESIKPFVYLLLDFNYNIIDIYRKNFSRSDYTINQVAQYSKKSYYDSILKCIQETIFYKATSREGLNYYFGFDYNYVDNICNPCENYTINQIMQLANRINYYSNMQSIFNKIVINYELVSNSNSNSEYFKVINYIKFLSNVIKEYYSNLYKMCMLNIDRYPTVYEYVLSTIIEINKAVDYFIKRNETPTPRDVIYYLGQNNSKYINNSITELKDVINLLLYNKGYELDKDNFNRLKKVNNKNINFVSMADNLLSLLDVSDEEVKRREEEFNKGCDINTINLEEYFKNNNKSISLSKKK